LWKSLFYMTSRIKLHGQSQNWRDLNFFFLFLFFLSGALNNTGNYSSPGCNICNTVRSTKFLYPWLAPMSFYKHSKLTGPKYTEIPSVCKRLFVEEQWMATSLWIPRCIQMRSLHLLAREKHGKIETEEFSTSFVIRKSLFAWDWPRSLLVQLYGYQMESVYLNWPRTV